jgi:hypothetical protein
MRQIFVPYEIFLGLKVCMRLKWETLCGPASNLKSIHLAIRVKNR